MRCREFLKAGLISWKFLVVGNKELLGQELLISESSCSCTPCRMHSVGNDESVTRKSHRYVCLAERFLNVEYEERIEKEASFDREEKNC